MDTNRHESGGLVHRDLVYAIVRAAIEVLNTIGHGLHEKVYEDAMVVELGLRDIPVSQQMRFPVTYKGHHLTDFVPDLVVAQAVVADPKTTDKITGHERGKMINYLRVTKLRIGVLLNFKYAKLEWERIAR